MRLQHCACSASTGITTLVTSCPICLKVFREEYHLEGIEVLHHSGVYAAIDPGRPPTASPSAAQTRSLTTTPANWDAGAGIYDQPREVIEAVGELLEPAQTRETRPLLRLFGGQYGDFGRAAASLGAFRGEGVERYGSGDDRNGLSTL